MWALSLPLHPHFLDCCIIDRNCIEMKRVERVRYMHEYSICIYGFNKDSPLRILVPHALCFLFSMAAYLDILKEIDTP